LLPVAPIRRFRLTGRPPNAGEDCEFFITRGRNDTILH